MQLYDIFDSRHEISDGVYYAALLHDHPELLNDCCKLINMEWKRSHVARLRSISGSCSNFPASIILLKESSQPRIIGHCKLSKISHSSQAVFIDTVVIHPDYRGKGLGKLLMEKAELYLKSKNIECIYLTTMGQELFYEKLGYSQCEPINIYGGQLMHISETDKKVSNSLEQATQQYNKNCEKTSLKIVESSQPSPYVNDLAFTPPPPPPMPSFNNKIAYVTSKKTFMKKKLFSFS